MKLTTPGPLHTCLNVHPIIYRSAAHLAIDRDNRAVLAALLKHGADGNMLDPSGHTLVHWTTGKFSGAHLGGRRGMRPLARAKYRQIGALGGAYHVLNALNALK